MNIISLDAAREALEAQFGNDVVIATHPVNPAKPETTWVFTLNDGSTLRVDGMYYKVVLTNELGYPAIKLDEEPNTPQPADGSPRIVGQIVVEINSNGLIRTRKTNGFDGTTIEVFNTSLSKGELANDATIEHYGDVFYTNPKRLSGAVQPVLVQVEFPDSEGMTPAEFAQISTDGRSLSALVKLGLLK